MIRYERQNHTNQRQQGFSSVLSIGLLFFAVCLFLVIQESYTTRKLDDFAETPQTETAAQMATAEAAEKEPDAPRIPKGLYASKPVHKDRIYAGTTLAFLDNDRYAVTVKGGREGSWLSAAYEYERSGGGTVSYKGALVRFTPEGQYPGLLAPRFRYAVSADGRSIEMTDGKSKTLLSKVDEDASR